MLKDKGPEQKGVRGLFNISVAAGRDERYARLLLKTYVMGHPMVYLIFRKGGAIKALIGGARRISKKKIRQ